ncbi:hypothetical protein KW797_03235 [Candidatus Parcubacteria bacterium]|nr:hypothetical protein [Candidatus Parcubacteria bacterium]
MSCKKAILLILDQVDFTRGACHFTEMVSACLSVDVINRAHAALQEDPQKGRCRDSLQMLLGNLDYTQHRCSPTAMVAAALDRSIIEEARSAVQEGVD